MRYNYRFVLMFGVILIALFAGLAMPVAAQPVYNMEIVHNGEVYISVWGYLFPPNSPVTVTIYNSVGGSVLFGPLTETTNDAGTVRIGIFTEPLLIPGQLVVLTSDTTGLSVEFVTEVLVIDSIDAANNLVHGRAQPGAQLNIESFNPDSGSLLQVTTAADGTWTADFGAIGLDITNNSGFTVGRSDGSGTIFTLVMSPTSPSLVVTIDVKPGSDPNCVNNNGRGAIPVAIWGSATLDVTQIELPTIRLDGLPIRSAGKSGQLQAHFEDVNGDSVVDLVAQFADVANVLTEPTATLTGYLFDGTPIEGTDSICLVP